MMASIWLLAVAVGATSVPAIAGTIDASNYLQPQGWKPYDTTSLSRSPVPDVVALVFYEKGNLVPSCGLLTVSIGGKGPAFLKLVDSDPGVGFSQCLSIPAITPFKLQNKEYIVIAYLLGETRKDVDRHFHYLVRSEAQGFVIDKLLTEAVPVTTAGKGAAGSATAKPMDGVRLARLAQLRQAHPAWLMIERDFTSNKFSKIFFSTLLLFSSDVFATSFDCKKAQSPVEKLICSDPKISSLDEKLARDYKSAIQSSGGNQFIAGQRKWIIEFRDKCLTSDCLINAYVVRGKWLLAHARPDESCNFSEPDLLRH